MQKPCRRACFDSLASPSMFFHILELHSLPHELARNHPQQNPPVKKNKADSKNHSHHSRNLQSHLQKATPTTRQNKGVVLFLSCPKQILLAPKLPTSVHCLWPQQAKLIFYCSVLWASQPKTQPGYEGIGHSQPIESESTCPSILSFSHVGKLFWRPPKG